MKLKLIQHATILLLSAALAGTSARAHAVTPCTTVGPVCTEFVTLGRGATDRPEQAMIYTSYSLNKPNPAIRRALIMVHGTNRNADHYFKTSLGAAFLANALDDTVVIAPSFLSAGKGCDDKLAPNEISWSCRGDSWRSGGASLSDPALSSFDFVDELLRRLADKKNFPNLSAVVVAGHSAGGQFVSRYEMANRVADTLPIKVTYVVSNPSSYAWPDATRALAVDDALPANAVLGWKSEKPHTAFTFGTFADAAAVPNYNLWPFGLAERKSGYTAQMSDDQLRKQLVSRPTTYLLSQVDTLPLGGFDSSPAAMAQGATRRARGEAFVAYLNGHMGAHVAVQIVPECGHNDRCVYTTDDVLPVIFPVP